MDACRVWISHKVHLAQSNQTRKLCGVATANTKQIQKYYPETTETAKGHLNQTRQGVQSTKSIHPLKSTYHTGIERHLKGEHGQQISELKLLVDNAVWQAPTSSDHHAADPRVVETPQTVAFQGWTGHLMPMYLQEWKNSYTYQQPCEHLPHTSQYNCRIKLREQQPNRHKHDKPPKSPCPIPSIYPMHHYHSALDQKWLWKRHQHCFIQPGRKKESLQAVPRNN